MTLLAPRTPVARFARAFVWPELTCFYFRIGEFYQCSSSNLSMAARRAKRENGGLGEDPPGSTMMTWPLDPRGSLRSGLRMTLHSCGASPPDPPVARFARALV
jgi:hypothetical protein